MFSGKYKLSNIDCSSCAKEIEKSISKIDGIAHVKINLFRKTLTIESEDPINSQVISNIQQVISSIESDGKISPFNFIKERSFKSKLNLLFSIINNSLIEIVISSLLLIVCIFTKDFNFILSAIFAVLSIIICGYKIFFDGVKSILKLKLDETSLMTIAIIAAFFIGDTVDAVIVILLFRIGSLLESKAIHNSRHSIKSIAKIIPDTAWLVLDSEEKKISIQDLNVDDIFSVHPFERVPCDGVVVSGSSSLDLSALTGESLPELVFTGKKVLSGSVNTSGLLFIKATKAPKDSAASRILQLLENANETKADTENIITRFARIYTPIVILLALILILVFPLLGLGAFTLWLKQALVLLVASCPCAIVISVPLAFYSGVGAASKFGVLFKGSKHIETLAIADSFVFDKTATLTNGKLAVTKVHCFDKISEDEILKISASVEMYSDHPIARAIKEKVKFDMLKSFNIQEVPGFGIKAKDEQDEIMCGRRELFENNGFNMESFPNLPFYVAINEKIVGGIDFADSLREDTPETIDSLKKLGIKNITILSGDSKETTSKIAKECGISKYYYKLMPEDKVEILKKIKSKSKKTIFVGDGINDTPTLACADCGIAMGFGSQAAIETGDIVLTNDSIKNIPKAVLLARKTISIIKFNITFSLLIKLIVLVLAILGFSPMWLAVLADTGLTVIAVILSSLPKR
ncbi:MAG: Cadmium, zinc and cobalt-transporting ATPase [Eubacteriales bacterium SKADARSKE-1]|nr:Cadmium, zinc and cobalt-transporting ATPase [Eubacteriales bacterium SKADARSKE-1]